MTELHQTAIDLARINADYDKTFARLARIKALRRTRRIEHRSAIVAALTAEPTTTNVDLAARFAVTEGTIRNVRLELATNTP